MTYQEVFMLFSHSALEKRMARRAEAEKRLARRRGEQDKQPAQPKPERKPRK